MSGGVAPTPLPSQPPSFTLQHHHLLSFQNLNAATLAVILAASGLIGPQDLAFTLLSSFYILFLSKFSFPTLSTTPAPPIFASHHHLLTLYVSIGAVIGLVLPVAYIIHGVLNGDKEGIKAAAPHVFLLACQVVMESVTFCYGFSLPIRVFVPVAYNSMRMYAILDWVKSEMVKVNEGRVGNGRLTVGRGIALVNFVFWGFNLFGFLLPVYMPKAFKKYYDDDDEKNVKDKDT